ncbi:uncharacterized protein LOC143034433 isoform X2 [Oratosquilla oratoria]
MGDCSRLTASLVVVNSLVFFTTVFINQLAAFPQYAGVLFEKVANFSARYGLGAPSEGIFMNSVGNLSAKYEIDVTPAGYTFIIWSVIYVWLFMAHVYALILLCRRNAVGAAFMSPPVLTPWPVAIYTFNLLCNITWVFLWDHQLIIYSSAFLWAIALSNWIALGWLHRNVYVHGPWMARHAKVDLWMLRILWHNGLALYTAWTTVAALLNLGIALRYEAGLDMQTVSYVVLGTLSAIMILWFILENTVLDRFVRYTVTPYAVIVHAVVGIYFKKYDLVPIETGYFIVALLGTAVFCLVARIGLVILRGCKRPLYTNNKIGDDPVMSYAA